MSFLFHPQVLDLPWEKRVFNLTPDYANYATQLNQIDGFSEVPFALDEKEFQSFQNEFFKISKEEPQILKKIKNHYIHGIYLCKNLGSTGLSGIIQKENQFVGGFIILDVSLLRNANDWISFKENTVFALEKKSLKIQIEKERENLLHNAIDYILLHELGHIVSVVENFVPSFTVEYRDFQKTSFTKLDWKEETESIHESKIPKYKEIKFYSKPSLKDSDLLPIYTALEQTPFPTLYAATNADDHFAESFVSYAHLYIKQKPWKLKVFENQTLLYETENGIVKERCKKEREFLEKFFERFK